MILEILIAVFLMSTMASIIIASYGKQQAKHNRRHKEWMKENLKKD